MLKILLADDSLIAQSMGKKILTDAGYDVITVSNGAAAAKKIPELMPDLVLLDIYMPGYSGLEVCERIKNAPETENIPVLLTVGKLEPFRPEEGMRVKAEGVVIKPFEATDLVAVVSKMAERVAPVSVRRSPVPPVAVPRTAVIPDYSYGQVELPPRAEQPTETGWAAAAMPAFSEDLLTGPEPEKPDDDQPPVRQSAHLPTPVAAESAPFASAFSDFDIQLEPLPVNHAAATLPQAEPTAPAPIPQTAAFPTEFELAAPDGQPAQSSPAEELVDFPPFIPDLSSPEQAQSEARFEEAMEDSVVATEIPEPPEVSPAEPAFVASEAESVPALHMDDLMGGSESVPLPQPRLELAGDRELVDDLSRALQEALASVEEGQFCAAPDEEVAEYDLDTASPEPSVAPEPPAVSVMPEARPASDVHVHRFPGPASAEAVGAVIDLDSILDEPPQTETEVVPVADPGAQVSALPVAEPEPEVSELENVASLPSVPEQPAPADVEVEPAEAIFQQTLAPEAPASLALEEVAPVATSAEDGFDLNQAIAEQVAERVIQRLKPQLIEEIRNVLKEM